MKHRVGFTINGEAVEVEVEPRETLLDVIREKLNLKGTKEACDQGECGACTVLMNGKPVYSCLMLGVEAEGSDILTVEGLARGEKLHPLQEAFREHGAVQCGYCTPGMLLSAKALLDENPRPTEAEVRLAIAGNICRCTGYVKIVEAIQAVAERGSGTGR
ncbi:MAG: (2Fe-2S)-binding protein [Chloroflexi bacterium]|nr:(2Fe-2S)-binding protein [Chloroflexota bacterium]